MESSVSTSKTEKLREYRAARDRATAWLLRQLNGDGSLGNPHEGFFFYRAPWTFAAVGETEAGSAVCGWIRRHMLTPQGTLVEPYRTYDTNWGYMNSCLIVGAQMLQQYDLSYGLMPDLLSWQDPLSGGFPNDLLPDGSKSDNMDIPYTCGPGFACLATGHLEAARRVYGYLHEIYAAQPALPDRFYYAWSRSQQAPITEYPEERRHWYVVENQVARAQRWTVGGIAAAFLCRLYLADPGPEYLALARLYQAFSMSATERQFEFPQVCKSSWGSSLLYLVTGAGQYLSWTYRMGDWYTRTQAPDGSWRWWNLEGASPTTQGTQIELTLEFTMHLDTLIGALASRIG